ASRDPPPFPTRRSSDLHRPGRRPPDLPPLPRQPRDAVPTQLAELPSGGLELAFRLLVAPRGQQQAQQVGARGLVIGVDLHQLARSEEHTSELQSRENLV